MTYNYVILADSTCDLGRDLRDKYDIDYVKMQYFIDEDYYDADLNWSSEDAKKYYDLMRNGTIIRTTQVPNGYYVEAFRKYLEQGQDILYLACSSALSGSINVANIVSKELMEEFPERKILCLDTLCSSLGQGHMTLTAAKLRAEGKDIDEVYEYIKATRLHVNQFGTVESLEYLKRVGRVTASSAFFGNLFGVKPIIISDVIGQNYAFKKVKGAANVRKEIASLVAEVVEDNPERILYISHADNLSGAEKLRDLITENTPFAQVYINTIGPIVGASVGPGTLIVYCYGAEVTIEGKNS